MTKEKETSRQVGTEVGSNQVGSDGLPTLQSFMTIRAMKLVLRNPEVQGKERTSLRRSLETKIPYCLPQEVLQFQTDEQLQTLTNSRQFFAEAVAEMRTRGWFPEPDILTQLIFIMRVGLPEETQRRLFLSMAMELQKYKPSKRSTISYMNFLLDDEFIRQRQR